MAHLWHSLWTLFLKLFFGWSKGHCGKEIFASIPLHILWHTHTFTCGRDKGYTYICIHLSPNDWKESFNSCYLMVYFPWVLQNGSIITSHVCILLNYLSLFPEGKRQGGRQLIQCKWKAFEAPYGEDVITVRRLITQTQKNLKVLKLSGQSVNEIFPHCWPTAMHCNGFRFLWIVTGPTNEKRTPCFMI